MAYLGVKGKYLGKRLTIAREEKGYTKSKLAELVGTDYNSILRYEKGTRKPNTTMLLKLADELGVRKEWLTSDEEWTENDPLLKTLGHSDEYYEKLSHPVPYEEEQEEKKHVTDLVQLIKEDIDIISDDAKRQIFRIVQKDLIRIRDEERAMYYAEIEKYIKEYKKVFPKKNVPDDINRVVRAVNKERESIGTRITLLPNDDKDRGPIFRKKK